MPDKTSPSPTHLRESFRRQVAIFEELTRHVRGQTESMNGSMTRRHKAIISSGDALAYADEVLRHQRPANGAAVDQPSRSRPAGSLPFASWPGSIDQSASLEVSRGGWCLYTRASIRLSSVIFARS